MTDFAGAPARSPLVNQPSAMPTRKIAFTALAGAIVTVAIFAVQTFVPEFQPPEAVVAAMTTILAVAVGWLVRERA
jgi:hypothetical protein